MTEQEDHILLSKQASIKKLAVPLFLITGTIYFLVALNQFFFMETVDHTFLVFGAMYGMFAFTYICHTTSESRRKLLALKEEEPNNT